MSSTIADVLNQWYAFGVFKYVFPFLIIFALVFAILQKSKILGDSEKAKNVTAINAVIAIAIGLLSLLNEAVPSFFEVLFPKFGIALAIFLVLLILLAFAGKESQASWVGWVLGVGLILWAWTQWSEIFYVGFDMQQFFDDYFWGIILLVGIGALIYWITKGEKKA